MKVAGVAHDGPTALELVRNTDLDALLLDIILPKMDGFAVLEKARELPKRPRIIVFSAFCNEEMTKRAIALGADYFIVKPFALEVLAQRIKEICGRGEEHPPG
jgi:two-component system response regulator (stage 0 sporulation protein A)